MYKIQLQVVKADKDIIKTYLISPLELPSLKNQLKKQYPDCKILQEIK